MIRDEGLTNRLERERILGRIMMQSNYFKVPRNIVYGWGSLEDLGKLKAKRVAVFTDKASMEKFGFLQKTTKLLREAGVEEVDTAFDIAKEPTVEDVRRNLEWAKRFAPDTIVALGGGSVIDVAKTVRALLDRPSVSVDCVARLFDFPREENKIENFVAIPSTSGTGSEATPFVVFVDPKLKLKRVLVSDELMPDVAIVDPEIPSTMPPNITANTGFDVLTHAIESYVCTASNDFTEPLALRSTQMIFDYLERCYRDGSDKEAREKVHYASTFGGIAIANSAGGLAHRMDQIGPQFDLPHGLVLGILFPYVMQYNAKVCATEYAEIAKVVGVEGSTEDRLCQGLIQKTAEFGEKLGMPPTLEKAGVKESELRANVVMLSRDALAGLSAKFNPRELVFEEVERVFWCAFKGEPVTF
jgi:alcohol dehydrogenase class IV